MYLEEFYGFYHQVAFLCSELKFKGEGCSGIEQCGCRSKYGNTPHLPLQWLLKMQKKTERHSPGPEFGLSVLGFCRRKAMQYGGISKRGITRSGDIIALTFEILIQRWRCSPNQSYESWSVVNKASIKINTGVHNFRASIPFAETGKLL